MISGSFSEISGVHCLAELNHRIIAKPLIDSLALKIEQLFTCPYDGGSHLKNSPGSGHRDGTTTQPSGSRNDFCWNSNAPRESYCVPQAVSRFETNSFDSSQFGRFSTIGCPAGETDPAAS